MNGVEVVASWFTPTVLFCVLNLMIGTIFFRSTLKPPPPHRRNKEEEQPPPSLFERVKSFNLSIHRPSQPDPAHHADVPAQEEIIHHEAGEPHHVTRTKSDTVAKAAPAARRLQRSASERVPTEKETEAAEDEERRRPATVRERTAEEDDGVDEKADDFIIRFRQQLKLQRLDSLLRHRAGGR